MSFIYLLSKIFAAFFLPPGPVILLLLTAAVVARRFKFLFAVGAAVLYLLSTSMGANALLAPLERPYAVVPPSPVHVGAVIVLGGGAVEGSPNLSVADGAFKRLVWGIALAHRYGVPMIFSGGGFAGEQPESTYAVATLGALAPIMPPVRVIEENSSLDTYENALMTAKVLDREGLRGAPVLLVTSAYHMRRAVRLFAARGIDAVPAATDFQGEWGRPLRGRDWVPGMEPLAKSGRALREYAGLVSLIFRDLRRGER